MLKCRRLALVMLGLVMAMTIAAEGQPARGTRGAAPVVGAGAPKPQSETPQAAPVAVRQAPSLQTLGQTAGPVDPFPPVNPKFFTAASPTVATVDAFLRTQWGYDSSRRWRVEGIQTTAAPGVSKVTVFVSDKGPNAKVSTSSFFVTPDGKHAIADSASVLSFGAHPYAENRKMLEDRATGPARGAAGKELLLVEFSDLQCPHCKDAQLVVEQLRHDFPKARVVFQNYPLAEIHASAFAAAAYGACVAKKGDEAFFTYAQAVYDTQAALTVEGTDLALRNAVIKAGADPQAVAACAASDVTRNEVKASMKLGEDVGVTQTPMLAVNGRLLALTQIPYETLKRMVAFEAAEDGVK